MAIASANKKNFFIAHYEIVVLLVGVLALAGGVFFMSLGGDEVRIDGVTPTIPADAPSGVEPVSMEPYHYMTRITKDPFKLPVVADKEASFLASERRIRCAECAAPIPTAEKICPFCKKAQPEDKPIVYDTDGDGLPDDWEKRYGLNINDPSDAQADTDGDLFTNAEEFAMGTDPTDAKSHAPYSNYLRLQLPLKETKLPFYFDSAIKIPAGHRFKFINPTKFDKAYNRKGVHYTPATGEEIGDTGYIVKSYEAKSEKRAIASGRGMEKMVDTSTATVVRKSDNKEIVLTVGDRKLQMVDVQATIVFELGETREFNVIVGDTIDLNGEKHVVKSIRKEGNAVRVLLEHSTLGTKKLLEALEQ